MTESPEQIIQSVDTNGRDPGRSASTQHTGQSDAGMSDEALREVLDSRQTQITVIGCGGGGCNTLDRMADAGIHGADLIAVNTDAQHLTEVQADSKLLIGKQATQGRGTGSVPQVGEQAAKESLHAITDAVEDADMVFLTAGLGGGTGTGATPVLAKAAREANALTVAIVTMPFTSEGEVRRNNAEAGLERLREVTDTVIVIPNDRLLRTAGNLPIQQAFQVADEVLMRSVKGVTELITRPSLVNLDFADLTTIMETGGVATIGIGESDSETDRAREAAKSAIRSPMLDVDISGAHAALVNVTGGPDMSVEEAETIVKEIHSRVDQDARIIWGASVDESLQGTIRTMLVATGVSSPQVYGPSESSHKEHASAIDYVE